MAQEKVIRRSALAALVLAWAQGKLSEHPPRLGWADWLVIGGALGAWLLGLRGKKK